jgi:hypothetical protein
MTAFTLDSTLEKQISFIAESEHKPVSTWISEKLTRIIEDYEDIKAADLAMLDPVTFSESEAWSMIDDVDN